MRLLIVYYFKVLMISYNALKLIMYTDHKGTGQQKCEYSTPPNQPNRLPISRLGEVELSGI